MALKGVLTRLTGLDTLLVVGVALLVVGSFWLFRATGEAQRVVIEKGRQTVYTAELNVDQTFSVEGPLGPTVIQISDGRVRVLSSPCPAKVCIRTGEIHHPGQLLACVPNGLIVRVDGDAPREDAIDLISR